MATIFTAIAPMTMNAEMNTLIDGLLTTIGIAFAGLEIPVTDASIAPMQRTVP